MSMQKTLNVIGIILASLALILSLIGHNRIMLFGSPVMVSVIFWLGYRLYRYR